MTYPGRFRNFWEYPRQLRRLVRDSRGFACGFWFTTPRFKVIETDVASFIIHRQGQSRRHALLAPVLCRRAERASRARCARVDGP